MTGADLLIRSLADAGVDHCFANPGTSEMHLLAALDREPRIRPILCLFEGVASGAADGYARISGKPALTLLHLGPGYANAAANIHNARRAFSPMINLVGDHATSHRHHDAPLASDIEGLARTSSIAVLVSKDAARLHELAQEALIASGDSAGGPVTLVLPADHAWTEVFDNLPFRPLRETQATDRVDLPRGLVEAWRAAKAPVLLLGGEATACEQALLAAGRIQAAGGSLLCDTFVARQLRGADRIEPRRLPYFAEEADALLAQHDLLILCGTDAPVSFFAYPGRSGDLLPHGTDCRRLCTRGTAPARLLQLFADALGAPPSSSQVDTPAPPAQPQGVLTPHFVGQSLACHLPRDAIISDDGVTSSGPVFAALRDGPRHDWLSLTGGAIGQGLPVAIGAALAAPGRRVVALSGDGAAMYTPQSLWTMAREKLDIVTIVFVNQAYRILDIEFVRTGAGETQGRASRDLLDLSRPAIDWPALAASMGVVGQACQDAASFDEAVAAALAKPGPSLIAAMIA